ncbi:MAG TPA: DUF2975 domain-containing protein [Sphingomicrobium sp.]|nr:DUF2975 domain-containing protein [Sphingomicrobium sp.]
MAWITLRILIAFVWLFFACVLALLLWSLLDEGSTSKLLGLGGLPQSMSGIRSIAILGILTAPINYAILKCLLDMVETVRSGDPFVRENAYRLSVIAWLLLIMGAGNIIFASLGKGVSISQHPFYLDVTWSVNGWLTVILTFVLAQVFAAGARMREDLEGTV